MSDQRHAERLVSRLTMEEKAAMGSGAGFWRSEAVSRLGIPSVQMNDGPHGLRIPADDPENAWSSRPATCFPTASCIAGSWDMELVAEVGAAIAEECRAFGTDLLLGPGVNIKRTPLCGRNFEYYSEDPFLAGELGAAFVRGAQHVGVGATVKHFACNNSEYQRMTIDVRVDERPLREIYLRAFERIVRLAQPWAVMAAYNQVNGHFACEHEELLEEILRGAWEYPGVVVSDWMAVYDRVKAVASGLDLEMPGPSSKNDDAVAQAVRDGRLSEETLNRRALSMVRLALRAAECAEGRPAGRVRETPAEEIRGEEAESHHQLARRSAAESMVLIKNEPPPERGTTRTGRAPKRGASSAPVLPLDLSEFSSLAVVGRFAEVPRYEGGGSSKVRATRVESVLEGLRELIAKLPHDSRPEVKVAGGYGEDGTAEVSEIEEAAAVVRDADAALLIVGLPDSVESEGFDRAGLELPKGQVELIRRVCAEQPRAAVTIVAGAPLEIASWLDEAPSVLLAGLAGQAGGGALVDVVTGAVNPGGKLAETWPVRLEDTPCYLNYPGEAGYVRYGEGIFVGYRGYEARRIQPALPFGHGLSYSRFTYGTPSADRGEASDDEELVVRVPIKNESSRDGTEVVQLYVEAPECRCARPPKELAAFTKLRVSAGDEREAVLVVEGEAFRYWDPEVSGWVCQGGEYRLHVGSSSQDIRGAVSVTVVPAEPVRPPLTERSTLNEWLAHPQGRELLEAMIPPQLQQTFQAAGAAETEMFRNMPLVKLPRLTQGMITEDQVRQAVRSVSRRSDGATPAGF